MKYSWEKFHGKFSLEKGEKENTARLEAPS